MNEIISIKELLTIGHLLGVVLGMGSAFVTDFIFLNSITDHKLSETEIKTVRLTSKLVWVGLAFVVLFGLSLFLMDPVGYLASGKFLTKMTIVGVIILNGAVFHFLHIPRMIRHVGEDLPSSDEFARNNRWLMASGAISSVSWICAFIFASMRNEQLRYSQMISAYLLVITVAIISAFILQPKIFPGHKQK